MVKSNTSKEDHEKARRAAALKEIEEYAVECLRRGNWPGQIFPDVCRIFPDAPKTLLELVTILKDIRKQPTHALHNRLRTKFQEAGNDLNKCSWPVGRPPRTNFYFLCDEEVTGPKSPYCEFHVTRAKSDYQPDKRERDFDDEPGVARRPRGEEREPDLTQLIRRRL